MESTKKLSEKILKSAEKIWNYHRLNHELKKSDLIITLCSLDDSIAEYTAELYKKGFAPKIIFSGGSAHQNDLLNTGWDKPEAEIFADIAKKNGVPDEAIEVENKAQNTGDNIVYSNKIIQEKDLPHENILLVQKPYMERRTYATFAKQWPGKKVNFIVTSPPCTFEEYLSKQDDPEKIINIMVGDLQRIKIYPEKGFQIFQEIPNDVWDEYEFLVSEGFKNHLIES
ncbi:MAG: YdcF family protein [Candidatus Omnitrophica bacterium]|nr:YdcF family protein [Candidatus Omnitrophota bacterium]